MAVSKRRYRARISKALGKESVATGYWRAVERLALVETHCFVALSSSLELL